MGLHHRSRHPPRRPVSWFVSWFVAPRAIAAGALVLAALTQCGDDPAPTTGGGVAEAGVAEAGGGTPVSTAQELTTLREIAAGHYGEAALVDGGWKKAHDVLERIAARPDAQPSDLVALACSKLKIHQDDPAAQAAEVPKIRELCAQALRRDPKSAAAHYVLGVVAFDREIDAALAKGSFETAHQLAPDDIPTRMRLAEVLNELGERDRAIELYSAVRAMGREFVGAYYMPAIYRLATAHRQRKKVDAAAGIDDKKRAGEILAEHGALRKAGVADPDDDEIKLGNFGRVLPPRMTGGAGRAPATPSALRWTAHAPTFPDVKQLLDFALADANSDLLPDVVVLGVGADGASAIWLAAQDAASAWSVVRVATVPAGVTRLAVIDLENEYGQCLLALGGGKAALFSPNPDGSAGYVDTTAQLPALPADVRDLEPVDFGHDGHVDFALASADGVKLIRNDGVPIDDETKERQGAVKLLDATALAEGLAATGVSWVAIEDFDSDQDIDLCVGGAGSPTTIYTNLRKGRFAAIAADQSGLPAELPIEPLFADLDHDGRPDALLPGTAPSWQKNRGDGTFTAGGALPELAALWHGQPQLADIDLNGELDFVGRDADGELSIRFGALTAAGTVAKQGVKIGAGRQELADVDGDGDWDLAARTGAGSGEGVGLWCLEVPAGRSLALDLRGGKDNRQAVGAIVELRYGSRYSRRLMRGTQYVVGIGGESKAELVRISWPNGVVQHLIDPQKANDESKLVATRACTSGSKPAALAHFAVPQKEGLAGSCPFLYTWNGTTFEFVSDVLGITPLGLPMTESMYVPPDHDELVRVTGTQLAARDGEYTMQVTEELREVTYLDRTQLWVIDHPADVEVHPEERFCFPPFPPQKIHTVKGALAPVAVTDQADRDWTAALATIDGTHAVPFEPLDSRYLGLVTRHHLDLTLPDAVRTAKKVRLLMTGWLLWTDASVNVLASRNGSISFVPPMFSVPDGAGGWRECGPPVGFPAGKTKTMVVDVSELLNRADPRLRITASIRLYWDAIRIAVDDDDAPITVTKLEPKRARLWSRGFSAPVADARTDQPERFDWDRREPFARWNQHSGMLTRYGDVLPLLGAIDDRYIVMSAGDAIDLRFDATTTPPKPDLARTYLVFFDGWAKDADPNTLFSQTVEPLPFHGMSGYPYRADEHYPDDDDHLDWQLEWNTRPGRRLIPSMVPAYATPGINPIGTGTPTEGS
ncbi:MAG: hypothetical protein EXS13_13185 [Planctomycetes bacterium]|nr:hypothetical protein [Planctomycetota bacterium]